MDEKDNSELKKKIDQSWKDAVSKERTGPEENKAEDTGGRDIEVNFPLFISGLMMEGLIAIGDAEHPVTKKKEVNIPHGKFIIDTISMLKDKTKNNLTKEEGDMLEAILYDLRMRFVTKTAQKKV